MPVKWGGVKIAVAPHLFFHSLFVFSLGFFFFSSYTLLAPHQKYKQNRCLFIPSLLSRRKELANSVTLRFIPAREIAILFFIYYFFSLY